MDKVSLIDTLWVMSASFMVFFMNAGFAFVEAGFCRAKNVVNILGKNFVVFAIATFAFWFIGYGFMFGEGNNFIGLTSFFVNDTSYSPVTNIPLFAFFFFQATFAAAGGSIVSGAVAERIQFHSYILFTFLLIAFIYPIVGHWIWGNGWLAKLGFFDFAGSTAVHSVGGWAALSGVMLLGAREGKYRKDGSPKAIMGHSIPLATLGAFILWFGWYGFNAGSELAFDKNIARIALTTTLSSSAGVISSMGLVFIRDKKVDLSMIINGSLAGLVGVTAGCSVVTPSGAVIIGLISGILAVLAVSFFDKLHLDDPVGALAVHLVNGIWGTLAVGLFAYNKYSEISGLFYGGGIHQLLVQSIGIVAVGAFVFVGTYFLWFIIKSTIGIRVSREEELLGLDISEMGMSGYNGFQIFSTED